MAVLIKRGPMRGGILNWVMLRHGLKWVIESAIKDDQKWVFCTAQDFKKKFNYSTGTKIKQDETNRALYSGLRCYLFQA